MKGIYKDAIAISLFFLINMAFFWPMLTNPNTTFMGTFGDISYPMATMRFTQYNQEMKNQGKILVENEKGWLEWQDANAANAKAQTLK